MVSYFSGTDVILHWFGDIIRYWGYHMGEGGWTLVHGGGGDVQELKVHVGEGRVFEGSSVILACFDILEGLAGFVAG